MDKTGTRRLVAAIVRTAVEDWKKATRVLSKEPNNKKAKERIKELEEFFQDDWYQILRALAGDSIPVDMLEVLRND